MLKRKLIWLLPLPLFVGCVLLVKPSDEYLLEAKHTGFENEQHEFVVSLTNEGDETMKLTSYDGGFVDMVIKDKNGKTVYDSEKNRMTTQVLNEKQILPGDTVDFTTSLDKEKLPAGTYDIEFKLDKDRGKTLDVSMTWAKE